MRVANLNARLQSLGYDVEDLGNVAGGTGGEPGREGRRARQVSAADRGDLSTISAMMVDQALARRASLPLVLGGDHSVAVGTVAACRRYFRERGEKLGLIWIDAHADMNTPDTQPERQRSRHAAGLLHRAWARRN